MRASERYNADLLEQRQMQMAPHTKKASSWWTTHMHRWSAIMMIRSDYISSSHTRLIRCLTLKGRVMAWHGVHV